MQLIITTIGLCTGAGIVYLLLSKKSKSLENEVKQLGSKLKSAYVKFGKTFEHYAPLTKNFPGNKENAVFLGMPLDYVCFEDDEIRFVEVKTGNSQLSNKQKKIKKLIDEGKVKFLEVRYDR